MVYQILNHGPIRTQTWPGSNGVNIGQMDVAVPRPEYALWAVAWMEPWNWRTVYSVRIFPNNFGQQNQKNRTKTNPHKTRVFLEA
jgi:hypothetical protein